MYFARLDSSDTDPDLFVDRTSDLGRLSSSVAGYLDVSKARIGRAFRVTGAKGSGKTIFVRNVLKKLRPKYAGSTLFLEVDCRRCPGSREVFGSVAQCSVNELIKLKSAGAAVKPELLATAQLLNAILRFTTVELKEAHEHVIQYKSALGLSAKTALLSNLEANFGISLERNEKQIKQLTGSILLDEYRLCLALRSFFEDVRDQGFNVVVFIDNIDELHHDYKDAAQREKIRHEAQWVLELRQAPIALVACMRTYYADVARDIRNKLALDPLPPNVLLGILERRIKDEPEDVRGFFARGEVQTLAHLLAGSAPTPLAYIEWFKVLAEQDAFDAQRRRKVIEQFVRAEYAGVPFEILEKVARSFPTPQHEVDRAVLLNACGNSESELAAVQDRQVVLPNDFWNPTRFTLDPSLHILHPTVLP
jgi:hypothetical protein